MFIIARDNRDDRVKILGKHNIVMKCLIPLMYGPFVWLKRREN